MGKDRRSYKQWSCEETMALHRGVERYNKRWISILTDPELAQILSGRAAVQLKDKWRNIQKCEKRKSRPSREDRQPCLSSTTSIPAGSARVPSACDDSGAVLDLVPEDGHLQQRRSGRFTTAPRKCYAAESDSASGEEDADDEDFQCKVQDEEPEGSTAGEEEQTYSQSMHAHEVMRSSALAGSHTAAQSPGLPRPQPVSVSKRRIVTARAGPSLAPAGPELGLPGLAMIDTLDSGDSEQSFMWGAFQAAPRQQERPAALCMPLQGRSREIPLQTPQLQPPQYSAELLQALMRSAGDSLCGALPVHPVQRQQSQQQQQLWRDQGGAGTVVAQGLGALQGLEGAALGCAQPARHLSPQGPWPSAVPVNQSSVHQSSVHLFGPGLGPLPNVAVSSSLEVLSRPLSMPLAPRGGVESLRWQSGSPSQCGGSCPAAQLPPFAEHVWSGSSLF